MLKTHKFARKPFYVDAVRVSETNMEEAAKWCEGEIHTNEEGRFIKVTVHRPLTERQTQAFVGDWVLFAGSGYKVYTPKAFDKSFEKVRTLTKAQADEAGIKVPHEPSKKPLHMRRLTTNVGEAVQKAQEQLEKESGYPSTDAVLTSTGKAIIDGEVVAEVPEKDEAEQLIQEVLRQK